MHIKVKINIFSRLYNSFHLLFQQTQKSYSPQQWVVVQHSSRAQRSIQDSTNPQHNRFPKTTTNRSTTRRPVRRPRRQDESAQMGSSRRQICDSNPSGAVRHHLRRLLPGAALLRFGQQYVDELYAAVALREGTSANLRWLNDQPPIDRETALHVKTLGVCMICESTHIQHLTRKLASDEVFNGGLIKLNLTNHTRWIVSVIFGRHNLRCANLTYIVFFGLLSPSQALVVEFVSYTKCSFEFRNPQDLVIRYR